MPSKQFFKLYHGKNNLYFDEMMMMSTLYYTNIMMYTLYYTNIMMYTLYYTNMLSWISIALAHSNNSPRTDTLSWFRANQSLLCLFNAACLAEKQKKNTNIIVFGLTRSGAQKYDLTHLRHNWLTYYTTSVFSLWKMENTLIKIQQIVKPALVTTFIKLQSNLL
jgi:hypothetical protein